MKPVGDAQAVSITEDVRAEAAEKADWMHNVTLVAKKC